MATFIALIDYTEQGIRNFKDTTQRADAFVDAAKSVGVTVKEIVSSAKSVGSFWLG